MVLLSFLSLRQFLNFPHKPLLVLLFDSILVVLVLSFTTTAFGSVTTWVTFLAGFINIDEGLFFDG